MANPSRNNTISKDEFFTRIAKKVNYLPIQTVEDVYYSMVQIIKDEFRNGNGINLPSFGDLALKDQTVGFGPANSVSRKKGYQVYLRLSSSMKNYIKSL